MFKTGITYTKKDIYQILNVPLERQRGAWDTGYTKYNNDIFVFANIGVAGRTGHDYDNHWEGSDLVWHGRSKSNINQPLIQHILKQKGKVYVFIRTDDRQPFVFQGEAKMKSYVEISPVKIVFAFTKTTLIDVKEAWQILLKNANVLYKSEEVYVSPRQFHQYKIIKVDTNYVRIKRLSVDAQTEDDLTYNIFEGAISRINKKQGLLTRKETYNIVIIEAAIVWLLPMLDWDDDFKHVVFDDQVIDNFIGSNLKKDIKEADNDGTFKAITRYLRTRRGQNKLRENLFYLYQNKCCITKYNIKEVLHACHIVPHNVNGNNNTTNALLLRADVHDLFDSNLIGINPKSLAIVTDKALRNTEYFQINGIKICERIDKVNPDISALKYRWDIFNSGLK